MTVTRAGTQPSAAGPDNWFTGKVRIDSPFKCEEPGRRMGAIVTFECCARTCWRSHPLGQTRIVTAEEPAVFNAGAVLLKKLGLGTSSLSCQARRIGTAQRPTPL